jgi:enamine deaminase RidA (YjgF/YER057c/UK114 family)
LLHASTLIDDRRDYGTIRFRAFRPLDERLRAVFGEAGRQAHPAIGAASLPENVTVEIESILELE